MINQMDADIRLGNVLHRVIKGYISMSIENALDYFNELWIKYAAWKLIYKSGEDWDHLSVIGRSLVSDFEKKYIAYALIPIFAENKLIDCSGKILQPDFIGKDNDGILIVDFKYGRQWTQDMVDREEQLTRYARVVSQVFFEQPPIKVAVCNLNKDMRIAEWIFSMRTKEQLEGLVDKPSSDFNGANGLVGFARGLC